MRDRVWRTPFLDTPPTCLTPDDLALEDDEHASVQQQARHYDALLRTHGPLPWITARLGACHKALSSPASSIALFRQCLSDLRKHGVLDPELSARADEDQAEFERSAQASLAASKRLKYYQKWKATREYKFPLYIPHMPPEHETIKEDWMTQFSEDSELRRRYMTSFAIETQHVENTFMLTADSARDIIRRGISEGTVETLPESDIHDAEVIKTILTDTLAAFSLISSISSDPSKLTPDLVKKAHVQLMETARFFGGAYTPPGETRTTTKKTIVIQGACNIECCAYPETDAELDYICKMAKQYARTWRNPFGTAAWAHLILIRCQPFNDGNGRITRLVASLPLLVHGYPPMTILPAQKPDYHEALRTAANGEYRPLIECIVKGIENTMKAVRNI